MRKGKMTPSRQMMINESRRARRRSWLALWLQERRRGRMLRPPTAPVSLTYVDNIVNVELDWVVTSSDEDGLRVYRNDVLLVELPAHQNYYFDKQDSQRS